MTSLPLPAATSWRPFINTPAGMVGISSSDVSPRTICTASMTRRVPGARRSSSWIRLSCRISAPTQCELRHVGVLDVRRFEDKGRDLCVPAEGIITLRQLAARVDTQPRNVEICRRQEGFEILVGRVRLPQQVWAVPGVSRRSQQARSGACRRTDLENDFGFSRGGRRPS